MKSKILSLTLILAMTLSFAACSKSLGPETLPSTTLPTETQPVETSSVNTEPTETEPLAPEPTSIPLITKMPVKNYGQLYINNGSITTKNKTPVVLRGMSSDVLSECAGFFGAETVKTIAEDWGADVLRIAVPADKVDESYIKNAEKYFKQTCEIIDLCVSQGIYVIVDWHINNNGDPNANTKKAVEFFTRIAGVYADCPNLIYEICNEPNGTRTVNKKKVAVDWDKAVKPYAETVIKAIRAIDKDNIIIVGTPDWCRDIEKAADNPIKGSNICYSVHFNAASDGEALQTSIFNAKTRGICVIATEWKSTDSSGVSAPNAENTAKWLDFLDENKISWCNASIGGNNSASSNALIFSSEKYSIEDLFAGHWPDGLISESGILVRDRLLAAKGTKKPDTVYTPEDDADDSGDFGDAEDEPDGEEDIPEPEE